jgi:hypothetical protein
MIRQARRSLTIDAGRFILERHVLGRRPPARHPADLRRSEQVTLSAAVQPDSSVLVVSAGIGFDVHHDHLALTVEVQIGLMMQRTGLGGASW